MTAAIATAGHGGDRGWRVSRATVGGLAVVLLAADCFWVTSLHGAVGALERTATSPLDRWVRDSLVMLPLYVGAVWAAVRLTARWVGRRREVVRLAVALGLTVGLTTVAGVGQAAATATYDYRRQEQHLEEIHANHVVIGACIGLCAAKRDTVRAHVRGIEIAAVVIGASNSILGGWVLALRGGRLWHRHRPRTAPWRDRLTRGRDGARSGA